MNLPLAIPLLALLLAAGARAEPAAEAARALLDALSAEQRANASWAFDDAERRDVHYAPFFLEGVALGALEADARSHANALLVASLSPVGFETVARIRLLERDVVEQERGTPWGWAMRGLRDPGRYLFAFFGEPASDAPWGFRFEGHHLSLNLTHVPGAPPATTPLFLGAQPRIVPDGLPSAGVAVLGDEESLARRLWAALDASQRERAGLDFDDGRAWMIGQEPTVDPPAPIGLPRGAMDDAQKALLDALLARFAENWPEETARARLAELDAAGRDAIHFAWTESEDPPDAFYVRVQGPRILLEIDNTSDGDHVHAVWHDPTRDFGARPLAEHLRRSHGLGLAR